MIKTIEFKKLNTPDYASVYRSVLYFTKVLPDLEDLNVWLAGGCFRAYFHPNEKIQDIDIFTTDRKECAKLIWRLRKSGFKPFFINKNAIKGKIGNVFIDVVKKYYPDEITCIEDFDFSVSKFALNTKTKNVYHSENYFADLISKKLVIPDPNFGNPLGSLKRLQKYVKNGYTACNGTLITIAKRLGEIDFNDPNNNDIEFYPDGRSRIMLFD